MQNSQPLNPNRLFLASRIALIATAMTFAIRANLMGTLGIQFNILPTDMGIVIGTAFWGFTLSMIAGGFLCDIFGMKRLLVIAFSAHVLGIILTIASSGFWSLFISTLLVGIGNGMVEAACNPLVASLYPEQKTKKLNQFHVWFPGGIVIGGLIAFGLDTVKVSWEVQLGAILLPTLAYGVLFFNQTFPSTERVSKGISTSEMAKACLNPLFIVMVFCMLFTAATELGTNQWIKELLSNIGIPSILLLVFINGLMAIGRSFAGDIEHRLSASGMLLFSAIFSAVGLILLGNTAGYWSFAAAGIFAIGICFFWPTMLGYVSENMPNTGALGLSIIGGAGMFSVSLILPLMGKLYESETVKNLPSGYTLASLKTAVENSPDSIILKTAQLAGGTSTLQYIAVLPIVLTVAFAFLYFKRKK